MDYRNAFNTIRRDVLLDLVKRKLPNIYNYVHQWYAQDSYLGFGKEILNSSEGVQQEDPLGSFFIFFRNPRYRRSNGKSSKLWVSC